MRDLVLNQIEGISPRAIHCCSDVGILTLGDLFDFIKTRSLNTIKNCGMKTARELSRVISRYESQILGFKYDLFSVTYDDEVVKEAEMAYASLPVVIDNVEIRSNLDRIFAERLKTVAPDIAYKIKGHIANSNQLLNIVVDHPGKLLDSIDGWTIEEHFRFWDFVYDVLEQTLNVIDKESYAHLYTSIINEMDYMANQIRRKKLSLVRSKLQGLLITTDIEC